MVLVWYWYGAGMVFLWFWHGIDLVRNWYGLVGYCYGGGIVLVLVWYLYGIGAVLVLRFTLLVWRRGGIVTL